MPLRMTDTDIMDLFMGQEAMRRSTRNMEYGKKTIDDVANEAFQAIGGQAGPPAANEPLGQADRLTLLELRVRDAILRIKTQVVTDVNPL